MDPGLMSVVVSDLVKRLQILEERNVDNIVTVKEDNNCLTKRIQVLEEKEQKEMEIIGSLKFANECLQQKVLDLESMKTETLAVIGSVKDNIHNLSNRMIVLEEKNESSAKKVQKFKDQITNLSQLIQASDSAGKKNTDDINDIRKENDNLSKSLVTIQNENKNMSRSFSNLRKNLSGSSESTENDFTESIGSMKSLNESLLKRVLALEDTKSEFESSIWRVSDEVLGLEVTIHHTTEMIESVRDQGTTLSQRSEIIEKKNMDSINVLRKDSEDLRKKILNLQNENKNIRKTLKDAQEKISNISDSNVTVREEIETLTMAMPSNPFKVNSVFFARLKPPRCLLFEMTPMAFVDQSTYHKFSGDFYDISSGCLDILQDGLYCLGWMGRQAGDGEINWYLHVKGLNFVYGLGSTNEDFGVISGMFLIPLQKGQTIFPQVRKNEGHPKVARFHWYGWCLDSFNFGGSIDQKSKVLEDYLLGRD